MVHNQSSLWSYRTSFSHACPSTPQTRFFNSRLCGTDRTPGFPPSTNASVKHPFQRPPSLPLSRSSAPFPSRRLSPQGRGKGPPSSQPAACRAPSHSPPPQQLSPPPQGELQSAEHPVNLRAKSWPPPSLATRGTPTQHPQLSNLTASAESPGSCLPFFRVIITPNTSSHSDRAPHNLCHSSPCAPHNTVITSAHSVRHKTTG